ncbi:hypothetical protein [Arthrobacter sp. JSM 101049]|uniref:hypothetical protein n=1 Tax=Arthrobacter sp. JSM 101049 TaxID=929097 RepID=UPI0035613BA0
MTTLVLLALSGAVGLPQYFRRFRGTTNRWLFITAAGQVVLLAAAAFLAAGTAGGVPGWGTAAAFSVAAAALGGGPVTMSILRLSERSAAVELARQPMAAAPDDDAEVAQRRDLDSTVVVHVDAAVASLADRSSQILQGGAWIGVLERLAISATLWCGWPEGLAIVLAVKGLGRYAELGKDGAAERFILGTFASVLWACACTGVAVLATALYR